MLMRFTGHSKNPQAVLGRVACVLLLYPVSSLVIWFFLHPLALCVKSVVVPTEISAAQACEDPGTHQFGGRMSSVP